MLSWLIAKLLLSSWACFWVFELQTLKIDVGKHSSGDQVQLLSKRKQAFYCWNTCIIQVCKCTKTMAPTRDNLACKKFPDWLPVCWSYGHHVVPCSFTRYRNKHLDFSMWKLPSWYWYFNWNWSSHSEHKHWEGRKSWYFMLAWCSQQFFRTGRQFLQCCSTFYSWCRDSR